jgi:hypothetical protein
VCCKLLTAAAAVALVVAAAGGGDIIKVGLVLQQVYIPGKVTQIHHKIPVLNRAFTTGGRNAVNQSQACIILYEFFCIIYF